MKRRSLAAMVEAFSFPYLAVQDTAWVSDPANPVAAQTGPICQGETIWLQTERFGSGPVWQKARLANDTICFVQPHYFDPITP